MERAGILTPDKAFIYTISAEVSMKNPPVFVYSVKDTRAKIRFYKCTGFTIYKASR